MKTKRNLLIVLGLVVVAGIAAFGTRSSWMDPDAKAQVQAPRARTVPVQTAMAERKQVPVEVDAIGTVAPIRSVALKSRVETTITEVHFEDGARVDAGDVLFTLDARQIDAELAQAEGALARDRAQLAGAERDLRRYSELITKGATPQVNVDNATTQRDILRGTVQANQSAIDNLKVQKSYTVIRAPISGRISAANVKAGNFVRPADTAPLAIIHQIAPIYVSVGVPQRVLPDLRDALKTGAATVVATMPGSQSGETGKVTMIENTVDAGTGMITVRATMDNADEVLWPGSLVSARVIVRSEEAVIVPSVAVQRSQTGTFVFVVKDGKATTQPVSVVRTHDGMSVLEGLDGGETVVTDGQMLLSNGTAVEIRERKAGA
jgi:RND family efflux transporter MFP subunit